MLDATIELITTVSSNSHLVFCFANLIIGILFVSSSKSVLFQKRNNTFHSNQIQTDQKQEDNIVEIKVPVTDVAQVEECSKEEVEEFEDDKNYDGEDEKEDEDELRRRAEEFINKINSAWKAEKFGPNVHSEKLQGQLRRRLVV